MNRSLRGFLKIDFRGNHKFADYAILHDEARRLLAASKAPKAAKILRKMRDARLGGCYEYRLLFDRFRIQRNAARDEVDALKDLRCLLSDVRRYRYDGLSLRTVKYILGFQAEVLEELARCSYYMERDAESLRAYKELLAFAARNSLRLKNVNDIKRKVCSLVFMSAPSGFRSVERHVRHGCFAEAHSIIDRAVSEFGMGYLDHGALAIAAICNAWIGDWRKARILIDMDYCNTPDCLETRLFWALINLSGLRPGRAMHIIKKIANGDVQSSCHIAIERLRRMCAFAEMVSKARRKGGKFFVDMGTVGLKVFSVAELIRAGIWMVEVDHKDNHGARKGQCNIRHHGPRD